MLSFQFPASIGPSFPYEELSPPTSWLCFLDPGVAPGKPDAMPQGVAKHLDLEGLEGAQPPAGLVWLGLGAISAQAPTRLGTMKPSLHP